MDAYHQPDTTLILRRGPGEGQEFTLTEPLTIIGRHRSCDIQVDEPEVSRQHARITWSETGYVVEDLESANGTFVNEERISEPHALQDGDLLRLGGEVELAFQVAVPLPSDERLTMMAVEPPGDEPVEPPSDEPVEPPSGEPVEPPAPVPPLELAPAEEKGFPWVIVGVVVLVLLCLCLALAAGGYLLLQGG